MKRYVPASLDDILDSEEALDTADPRYVQMQAEHPHKYINARPIKMPPERISLFWLERRLGYLDRMGIRPVHIK